MSSNRSQPHVLVLPEDDDNRQLANGFHRQVDGERQRRMQVLPVAGGWLNVVALFQKEHVKGLERWPLRFMVLLVDFDGQMTRLDQVKAAVPPHLTDRVYVLGAAGEPEDLRPKLGSYESIGSRMAQACREQVGGIWEDPLLRHNAIELARLREHVRPILF